MFVAVCVFFGIAASINIPLTADNCNAYYHKEALTLKEGQKVTSIIPTNYFEIEFDINIHELCHNPSGQWGYDAICDVLQIGDDEISQRYPKLFTANREIGSSKNFWNTRLNTGFASDGCCGQNLNFEDDKYNTLSSIGLHHIYIEITLQSFKVVIDDIEQTLNFLSNRNIPTKSEGYSLYLSMVSGRTANATLTNICMRSNDRYLYLDNYTSTTYFPLSTLSRFMSFDDVNCNIYYMNEPLILKQGQKVTSIKLEKYMEIEFDIYIHSLCYNPSGQWGYDAICNIIQIGDHELSQRYPSLFIGNSEIGNSNNIWNTRITTGFASDGCCGQIMDFEGDIKVTSIGLHHVYIAITPQSFKVVVDNVEKYINFNSDRNIPSNSNGYSLYFSMPWGKTTDATVHNVCVRSQINTSDGDGDRDNENTDTIWIVIVVSIIVSCIVIIALQRFYYKRNHENRSNNVATQENVEEEGVELHNKTSMNNNDGEGTTN